ncbi:amidohydrolase [Desulfobacterales bacterium HSG16]|nr:amidohydrolase [Desulfobacterales bacterium HSG16]
MTSKENQLDILIENGTVLTMNKECSVIKNGAVAIKNDKILAVGSKDELADMKAVKTIDAKNGLIMPGLINTHTHAAMTLFRGMADDLPLMAWLNEHIFPAEAKLNAEKVYTGSTLACAEMIMSGTTCFCDMYLYEDQVACAAKNAGVRAVTGEVLFDFSSPAYGPIEKGFEYTRMLAEKWKNDPLIRIAVEPHSPYLCSADLLKKANEMAHEMDLLLVIHVSETKDEVAKSIATHGITPVALLAETGVLSPRLLACHCVVLSENDISLLKQYDVKVAHNPESNMKLASGIAPIPLLLEKGIGIGLGTDGCSSNNDLDMFMEMDTAAKLHKVNDHDPTVMDAKTTLKMCTIEGAKALGISDLTGSIEPGKQADVIIINTRKPHLTPMYNPMSHLVYAVRGSDVDTSVINGRVVMENRELTTIDLEKIMADARQCVEAFI